MPFQIRMSDTGRNSVLFIGQYKPIGRYFYESKSELGNRSHILSETSLKSSSGVEFLNLGWLELTAINADIPELLLSAASGADFALVAAPGG